MGKKEKARLVVLGNTGFSLLSRLAPALVAVVTTPVVIRLLGAEQFGVLALCMSITAYFALMDLSIGKALVNQLAPRQADPEAAGAVIGTGAALAAILSVLAALSAYASVPVLIGHVFRIPEKLKSDTVTCLQLFSIVMGLTLATSAFEGILQAYRRFGLLALLKAPFAIAFYAVPMIVVLRGGGLVAIAVAQVVRAAVTLLVYVIACLDNVPPKFLSIRPSMIGRLVGFGGWVSIDNIAAGILMYFERLVLTRARGLKELAVYAASFQLGSVTTLLCSGLMPVLFSEFSITLKDTTADGEELFRDCFRLLAVVLCVISGGMAIFAPVILSMWLGPSYRQYAGILAMFAPGMMAACLAWLFGTFLQAKGLQRATGLIGLVQVPVYIVLATLSVNRWGALGASAAWSIRALVTAAALAIIYWRRFGSLKISFGRLCSAGIALLLTVWMITRVTDGTHVFILVSVLAYLIGSCWLTWYFGFTREARKWVVRRLLVWTES